MRMVGGTMYSLCLFLSLAPLNLMAQSADAQQTLFKKCMRVLIQACSISLIAWPLFAADQPYKAFVKTIEHQYFVLRAQESLCRRTVAWDQRRIWECRLTKAGSSVAIEGVADWEGRYFVSGRNYRL